MAQSIKRVERYWDAYAAGLQVPGAAWGSKEFFADIKSQHDQVYASANEILNLTNLRGRSLLELGCGIGLDTVEFARHGAEVTAIDLSPSCITLAKRLLAYHGLEASLEIGDAEELPHGPNTFDIVVARGILMFTPNDRKVVKEIFRVLRPCGKVHILVHNRYSWYAFLAHMSGTNLVHEAGDPPVNKLYGPWEVRKIFDEFSSHQIFFDRYPAKTNRPGTVARLYNQMLVPLTQGPPPVVLRPIGFYIIVNAIK